jgi:NADPH-dependent 2,4-dienoyl-CoA reductase/sulfur reductase-like enzyme
VNIGAIDTNASFVAEVYVNGTLTGEINSDELVIPEGEKGNLTALLELATSGDYEIKGHVLYDGKSTDTKELSFAVTKAEPAET